MKDLSDVLIEHQEAIFAHWIPAIRQAAAGTRDLQLNELRDNLPLILDRIVHALRGEKKPGLEIAARMHGELRWEEGLSLQSILLEYTLLQRAIEAVATERLGRPLNASELRAIDDVRFQAIGESIEAYTAAKEAELRRAGEHKSRLLTALSHDVRTPLNAIMLSLTFLETNEHLRPEDCESVEAIRAGAMAILDLLRDLLDLSRLESGRLVIEETTFDLDGAITEAVRAVRALARYKGLESVLELTARTMVRTDRARLMQTVGNLLSNAIRYTERGRITVRSSRTGEAIRIEVADTGVGIATEDQARIFEEFYQVGRAHRPDQGGSGLGLAIAQRVARALGGALSLASVPGRGSTFTLTLPSSVVAEGGRSKPAPADQRHGPGDSSK